jgi:hypothetical protein
MSRIQPLPRPRMTERLDSLGWLGAVRGATALALAAVLALAALVASRTAAGAFTAVLALTGVFCRGVRVLRGIKQAGCGAGSLRRTVGGRLGRYRGSTDQAGERRRQKQCIHLILCHNSLTSFGVGAEAIR